MPDYTLSDDQLRKIHLGDCIAGMNALPRGSVDLAFADPPFNIGYDYDVYRDDREGREYLDWSRAWMSAVYRVLKVTGTFWLAIGDEYAAELKLEAQKIGFYTRSWIVWYYTFGVNCKSKFSRSHAHLFYFVKEPDEFTFRHEELENRIPSARMLVYGDRRSKTTGRLPDDTWILRPQDLADCFTSEEDTWYFPRVAGTFKERRGFHGCQMPEQLLGRIIRFCSNPGDVVLDPFSGSATTLAVAKKLGRQYLGFDLSPEYVQRGTERLARVHLGEPLDGAAEPMMSAPRSVPTISVIQKAKKSPLQEILQDSAAAQSQREKDTFLQGLIEAFQSASQGYSLDRVLIDPDLSQNLAQHCEKLGLPGDPLLWNRALLRARKAGKLAHCPSLHRTQFSWEHCDPFLYASEIAWRHMLDKGYQALDEILSDPAAVAQFDDIARSYSPGFAPLEYRWGALKLRKEARRASRRAALFGSQPIRFPNTLIIDQDRLDSLPTDSGIYLVTDNATDAPLYAGVTLSLAPRLARQFHSDVLNTWLHKAPTLAVHYLPTKSDTTLLHSYKALCIQNHKPPLNILDPSSA